MSYALMWSGLAQGVNEASDYLSKSDLRKTTLEAAKNKQKQSSLELAEFEANAPNRAKQQDLQMQQMELQTRQMNAQGLGSMTISAFDRYNGDGSVRHLNTWLANSKKNPVGQSIYGSIARYDDLVQTEANDKLLTQAGYTPADVYSDPLIAKDILVVTQNDGSQSLLPKEQMYATTGYTDYMDDQSLTKMERQAKIHQMMQSGMSGKQVALRERVMQDLINDGKAADTSEAYSMLLEMEKNKRAPSVLSSTEERAVLAIMEDHNVDYLEGLDMYYSAKHQGTGLTNEKAYVEEYMEDNQGASYGDAVSSYKNLSKTATQKEIVDVKGIREGLDKINWLDTKQSDLSTSERQKIYRDYISPLEDLRGLKLSGEERKSLRTLRKLTNLGMKAGQELTPRQTGVMDHLLSGLKTYMYNEVGGTEGTAAYNSFRNILVNAMSGTSLTEYEIKANKEAAGSLNKKFLPAMNQLKVQLESVRNQLETISDLGDPDIAHYRLGMSLEDIDEAVMAIEERINNPKLWYAKPDRASEVQKTTEEIPPTEDTATPQASFDFDAAMKEAGL